MDSRIFLTINVERLTSVKETSSGEISWTGLSVVPSRRGQALPERVPLHDGEVRGGTARLSARPARAGASACLGVQRPASRETEAEAHLRDPGAAGLGSGRQGRTTARQYRGGPPH